MDQSPFLLFGGSVAALLAGLYILWEPSSQTNTKKKKRGCCPGLVNLGNTCFLNAILQSLASCPNFMLWLVNYTETHPSTSCQEYLAWTLLNVMKILNNQGEFVDPFSPHDVINALRARRWVISADEQDAHELFHVLTETLDEETAKYASVLSVLDCSALEEMQVLNDAVSRYKVGLPKLEKADNLITFKGLLASQLQCKTCNHRTAMKYDAFDSLSLSIPTYSWGVLSIESLLRTFFKPECVQSVECENCAKLLGASNTPKRSFIKKLTLGKLPDNLCIHIQRTVWLDNGMPTKRCDHIGFAESLCLDEFINAEPQRRQHEKQSRLIGGKLYGTEVNEANAVLLNSKSLLSMNTILTQPPSKLLSSISIRKPSSEDLIVEQHKRKSCSYKLMSVIVHLGDVFSGHFVTYRRGPIRQGLVSDKWFCTSDTIVKSVDITDVLQSDAYMLFYQRV
ncbi:ubiquitin carboxyl-terminal hydrolase 30-like [Tubulanus polymorphus]|uniref:ubiquitin carboxyl-terminal hydrolase 30-like n=1 Tax=Tubulanus polymorphus TaxID=672921 RepID=UPI003DA3F2E2